MFKQTNLPDLWWKASDDDDGPGWVRRSHGDGVHGCAGRMWGVQHVPARGCVHARGPAPGKDEHVVGHC